MNKPITTTNIQEELNKYAQKEGLESFLVDFELLSYKPFIKTIFDEEYKLLEELKIKKYEKSHDQIFKEKAKIYQEYTILINRLTDNEMFNLDYEIIWDEFKVNPVLLIKKATSSFNTTKFSAQEIYKALYAKMMKIKAQNNILIPIFKEIFIKDLKSFVINLFGKKFTQDVKINLFLGIEPIKSSEASLKEHYKNIKTSENTLTIIEENTLLLEYEKPIYGKNGFNSLGEIVELELTKTQAMLRIRADEQSVLVVKEERLVKYYSKFKGYIKVKDNVLSIEKRYVVGNITKPQKTATNTEANNIEVTVAESDMTKDGVGDGVELVSQKIHITGAVGQNAVIKAKEATIDGMTHATSSIFGKDVLINRHLGLVRARTVHVKSLEGGTVYATHAKIDNIISGTISAETIEIGTIKNNAKIYGAETIKIEQILGEDNLIGIDITQVDTLKKKLSFYKEEIESLKEKIETIRPFPQFKDKTKQLVAQAKQKQKELIESLFDPFKAKIYIKEKVQGLNTIYFYIYVKNMKIEYKTKENIQYDAFKLIDDSDLGLITMQPVGKNITYL